MRINVEVTDVITEVCLEPRHIRSIIDKKYFIPDYQRGYRWEKLQVEQLLEDVNSFNPVSCNNQESTWYCLQPLVCKLMVDFPKNFEGDTDDIWYEVIDGQQRLTTIFLIGHYINEMYRGKQKDAEITLLYQTRKKSTDFLKNLEIKEGKVVVDSTNIDFHNISNAYLTIHNWIEGNSSFNSDAFIQKFYDFTKVIWYQTKEEDSIEIFTRLNTGKIPLTNAELVKALFLNASNFNKDVAVYQKQLQIATDWEQIEYTLHNDDFWYFLNKEENNTATRIEFILDILTQKNNENDELFTFNYYYTKFKGKNENFIFSEWFEIKQTFQLLWEWFTDPLLHNKIGFIIYCDLKDYAITDLIRLYKSSKKNEFLEKLDDAIAGFLKPFKLDKIEYKNNQADLRKILLLHNIETMNKNKSDDSKFPFKKFKDKKNGWDIEHVNSLAEKFPELEAHRKDWLDEAKKYIQPQNIALLSRIENWNKDTFKELFFDIIAYFDQYKNGGDDSTNSLGNLVLLDSKTNRGYKNSVFPEKRNKIISKDKSGQFIPICTKNVFMKYYSENLENMTFWTESDRENYLNNIIATLSIYDGRE